MPPLAMISLPFETIDDGEVETSKTYRIDWENGRISGYVDGIEAMKQFIKKAILTPRFKCLIYDSQYGSEIRDTLIVPGITREYIEAEAPFLAEDALIHDERVLRVYNFNIEFGERYPLHDTVVISFDVDTIYGKIPIEEVI